MTSKIKISVRTISSCPLFKNEKTRNENEKMKTRKRKREDENEKLETRNSKREIQNDDRVLFVNLAPLESMGTFKPLS